MNTVGGLKSRRGDTSKSMGNALHSAHSLNPFLWHFQPLSCG